LFDLDPFSLFLELDNPQERKPLKNRFHSFIIYND
jgi:hypothetical protein